MAVTNIDLDALAARFAEAAPRLDDDGRSLSLALYRLLAGAEPVPVSALATQTGLDDKLVRAKLESWPGVFFDDRGDIHGYWGLAIPEMKHRFEVAGKTLYTWCAWDSLFLPEILRQTAQVRSSCPVTGETIRLSVRPREIATVEPAETVVSFPTAERMELGEDVVANFCHFVHFFSLREAAGPWLEKNPGHVILSLEDALELARKKNALQFGALG